MPLVYEELRRLAALCLLALTAFSSTHFSVVAQSADIPDPSLEAVIRQALAKPQGDIRVEDMEALTVLEASSVAVGLESPPIRSLQGLETARNLTRLDLSGGLKGLVDVTQPGDALIASANIGPGSEGVANVIDNQPTKHLNRDAGEGLPVGFIVTPQVGLTTITGVSMQSANDAPERDPRHLTIEGSNDADVVAWGEGNWELIYENAAIPSWVDTFSGEDRFQTQTFLFDNVMPYRHYRWTAIETQGPSTCCFQIAEVELLTFRGPQVDQVDLSPLAGLGQLAELDLSDNLLTELAFPTGWAGLEILDLSANQLTSLTLPEGMRSLVTLHVTGNPIGSLRVPVGFDVSSFYLEGFPLSSVEYYVRLGVSRIDGSLLLTWAEGVLQETDQIGGAWNDVENASNPYSVEPRGPNGFFRVRRE